MSIQRIGVDITSEDRWNAITSRYTAAIGSDYHRLRLSAIRALMPSLAGADVVEFGCGEGVILRMAQEMGARSTLGIDQNAEMLRGAEDRSTASKLLLGGIEQLAKIERADCLIAANVLGYLTDTEEAEFYAHAKRILPEGGHLVIAHSNELFDVFTFNKFTVAFYKKHFDTDVSELLSRPTEPERPSFNIRENPLSYPDKLFGLGFEVERTEYMNFHESPPLLMGVDFNKLDSRTHRDTLQVPAADRWKLMLQCSMFGVRARSKH